MNVLIGTVAATALTVGLVFAIDQTAAQPDVHVSYSTGECVKVVNYTDETFACESLPTKFNHVWVQ